MGTRNALTLAIEEVFEAGEARIQSAGN